MGYTIISNDNLEFSYAISKTYIELNDQPRFAKLCKELKVGDIDDVFSVFSL